MEYANFHDMAKWSRANQMLEDFGLTSMIEEKPRRVRKPGDNYEGGRLTPIEREGLMVVAELMKGKH